MGNRRFEMYEYHQAIANMRLGASSRHIAKTGLMGRHKAAELRRVVFSQGWLEPESPLPEDEIIAEVVGKGAVEPVCSSSLVPYRQEVQAWWEKRSLR